MAAVPTPPSPHAPDASQPVEFRVIGLTAPLFRVAGLRWELAAHTADAEDLPTPVQMMCQTHFPQFQKRGLGWRLSVEEIHYLIWLSTRSQTSSEVSEPVPLLLPQTQSTAPNLILSFESPEIEQRYHDLVAANALACAAYAHLTHARHLRLRHAGSLYGALFIGYSMETQQHGEYLFFAGHLGPLAATRASRVASSVGKRAREVFFSASRDDVGEAVLLCRPEGDERHHLVVRELDTQRRTAGESGSSRGTKRRRV